MKYVAFVLCTLCTLLAFSQDSTRRRITKLEELTTKSGLLLKKEFTELGSYNGCTFNLIDVYDLSSGQQLSSGVKLDYSKNGGFLNPYTQSGHAYFEADELDDLIKFLTLIKDLKEPPKNYTEYTLTTKGDIKTFAFCQPGKSWTYGIDLSPYDWRSTVAIKQKDFDELIWYFTKAKNSIKP